jgi:hypothetical protein
MQDLVKFPELNDSAAHCTSSIITAHGQVWQPEQLPSSQILNQIGQLLG